jgi:chorismate synthase
MRTMLRWLTSGESHGEALVGILEGVPAGVEVTTSDIQESLARRRLGYGRGARMKFEQDQVRVLGGLRLGLTQGGPVAIEIGNTEWPKWVDVMSADPVDDPEKLNRARNAPLTRPRPGHADLVGMRKYAFDDARPVLERASARETATRVALGTVAAHLLEQAAGIRLVSHVVAIGPVAAPEDAPLPHPDDLAALDADPPGHQGRRGR